MKCPKCDARISKTYKRCPKCGASLLNDDEFNIELPSMKNAVEETYNDPFEDTYDPYGDTLSLDLDPNTKEYILDYEIPHKHLGDVKSSSETSSILDDMTDKMDEVSQEVEKAQEIKETEERELESNVDFEDIPNSEIEVPTEEPQVEEFENPSEEIPVVKEPVGEETKEEAPADITDNNDNEVSSPTVNNILEYEAILPEDQTSDDEEEPTKVKKNYLAICGLISLIVVFAVIFIFTTLRNNNTNKYDYKSELSKALDKYYNTNGDDSSELNTVLERVYKESSILESTREETYHRINDWLNEYVETDAENAAEFYKITNNYKELIENLYNNVEIDDVHLLTNEKYKEYLNKIENISQDSKLYYKALDFFNNSDYNEAYAIFNSIDETNHYYSKADKYKTKIINTVISYIKKDITRLEDSIDEKTDAEKLDIYKQIEDIITKYAKTYNNLDLTNNNIYQEYLTTYHSKVEEYQR